MRTNYCVNRAAKGYPEQLTASPLRSAGRVETSVGANGCSGGLPQARPAPSGGSAVHAVTSVGDE